VTLGLGMPVSSNSQFDMLYHQYWLVDVAGPVRGMDINANLDGHDADLGQALDFVLTTKISEDFDLPYPALELRGVLGAFRGGKAYVGESEGEIATRAVVEMRFPF
jgi:hypothetical protein